MLAARARLPAILGGLALVAFLAMALPFARHSVELGMAGLLTDLTGDSRLYDAGAPLGTVAVFAHMVAGAAITLLAPLQVVPVIRRRAPRLHRMSGYVIAAASVAAALGGLGYIVLRGTIGGWPMDVAFAGYGLCLLVAAVQTVRAARALDLGRHREWALRLVVLAIGSWIYRLHYGLWYMTTKGLWVEPDFTGLFDRIQIIAFYVPYLILVEIWIRWTRSAAVTSPGQPRPAE